MSDDIWVDLDLREQEVHGARDLERAINNFRMAAARRPKTARLSLEQALALVNELRVFGVQIVVSSPAQKAGSQR